MFVEGDDPKAIKQIKFYWKSKISINNIFHC